MIMKAKAKLHSIVFLFFLTLSFSCTNTEGECLICNEDPINISKKEILFNAELNTATISTKRTTWKLLEISYNNSIIDLSGINPQSSSFRVENPNFIFERKNSKEIYLEMSANYTGNEKKLIAILQDGDYFGQITVLQTVN